MVKIINENNINNLEEYTIIVPPNMEFFYKEKYINHNYNITTLNSFLIQACGLSQTFSNDYVNYIIMDKVYNKIKHKLKYYNNVSSNTFINNLLDTYDSYFEYDIVKNFKTEDLNYIFNIFEEELFKNGFYTLNMLYKHVLNNNTFNGNYLFLSLSNLNKNELLLLSKMNKEGSLLLSLDDINNKSLLAKLNSIKIDYEYSEIDYTKKEINYKVSNDTMDEVCFVNNDISRLIYEGKNINDILIICPNINTYESYFDLYLKYPFNKKEYTGVLTNRFIKLFVNILKGDFSCSNFINILKLNIFDIDLKMIDKIANYVFSWNLEKDLFYKPFTYNPSGNKKSFSDYDKEELKKLNDIKEEIIVPIKFLLENIKSIIKKKNY